MREPPKEEDEERGSGRRNGMEEDGKERMR